MLLRAPDTGPHADRKWRFTPIVGARADAESRRAMFLDDRPIPTGSFAGGDELPVTATAYRALERERQSLSNEKSLFAEQLRLVREFGDAANNDEYLAIREEEAVLDARLARLDDILSRARIVNPGGPGDIVAIGSLVSVLDLGVNETFDYVIDSAHAPAAPNAVSAVSPVGKALLGRSCGAKVTVHLPRKGRVRELEVLAISPLSVVG
jgi:transcription elongation factor GreA